MSGLMLQALAGLLLLTSSVSAQELGLRRILWSAPVAEAGVVQIAPEQNLVLVNDRNGVRILDRLTGHPAWENGAVGDAGYVLQWGTVRTPPDVSTSESGRLLSGVWSGGRWIGLVEGAQLGTRFIPHQLVSLELNAQGRVAWYHSAERLVGEPHWNFASVPVSLGDYVSIAVQREDSLRVLILNRDGERVAMAPVEFHPKRSTRNFTTLAADRDDLLLSSGDLLLAFHWDGKALTERAQFAKSGSLLQAEASRSSQIHLTPEVVIRLAGRGVDCWDRATGAKRFQATLKASATSFIGCTEGLVLLSGPGLTAIELSTGKTRWEISPRRDADQGAGQAVVRGGVLYWANRDEIWAIESESGRLLQQLQIRAISGTGGGNLIFSGRTLLVQETGRLTVFELVAEDRGDQSQ